MASIDTSVNNPAPVIEIESMSRVGNRIALGARSMLCAVALFVKLGAPALFDPDGPPIYARLGDPSVFLYRARHPGCHLRHIAREPAVLSENQPAHMDRLVRRKIQCDGKFLLGRGNGSVNVRIWSRVADL